MIKKSFKIFGMHCTSCSMDIDWELEETKGIKKAHTNYAKAETEVEYDPKEVDQVKIVEIVKKVGYKAEPLS